MTNSLDSWIVALSTWKDICDQNRVYNYTQLFFDNISDNRQESEKVCGYVCEYEYVY